MAEELLYQTHPDASSYRQAAAHMARTADVVAKERRSIMLSRDRLCSGRGGIDGALCRMDRF